MLERSEARRNTLNAVLPNAPQADMLFVGPIDPVPPFPRLPLVGTKERTEWAIMDIDTRIRKLAGLGLRAHPGMLEYRTELEAQILNGGPYWTAMKSAYF